MLTIVVYHYVRDLRNSRYPDIKGIDAALFNEQIEYIKKYYSIVKMEDVLAAFYSDYELPQNSLLLTFDDGYIDHYNYVFPILDKHRIQGSFFPSAKAVMESHVLSANKIHYVLAATPDKSVIICEIHRLMNEHRTEYKLMDDDWYYNKYAMPNRYDNKEIVFIKRMLQVGLPEGLRDIIVNMLFARYVTSDESCFARELYMDIDQISCMKRNGMYFGGHSYEHNWLNQLNKEKQVEQVDLTVEFLNLIGCDINNWVMCYPYGRFDNSLIEVLQSKGCKLGVTTECDIAKVDFEKRFTLPRIDAVDIPTDRYSEPNKWYHLVNVKED